VIAKPAALMLAAIATSLLAGCCIGRAGVPTGGVVFDLISADRLAATPFDEGWAEFALAERGVHHLSAIELMPGDRDGGPPTFIATGADGQRYQVGFSVFSWSNRVAAEVRRLE